MAVSPGLLLVLIFLGGWLAGRLAQWCRCPGLLGMFVWGVVLHAAVGAQAVSGMAVFAQEAKNLALAVILLRLGLGIRLPLLRQTGGISLLLGCGSCALEVAVLSVMVQALFDASWPVAAMTACMLAAISPAVVVPAMLDLQSRGYGQRRAVPTAVLSATSLDNVVAIFAFSVCLGLAVGHQGALLVSIPLSFVQGLVPGLLAGWGLGLLLRRWVLPSAEQLLLVLCVALVLLELGSWLNSPAVLGVTALGLLLQRQPDSAVETLAAQLDKLWSVAQIALFVVIGMQLDPSSVMAVGLTGAGVIAAGVLCRMLAVLLLTRPTALNSQERLFCALSFVPRATAQAALGGVALSRGLPEGEWILALSLVAIALTAPLGSLAIRLWGQRLLKPE